MAEQLDILKQLQILDGQIFKLRKAQEEKPRQLDQVRGEVAAQDARTKAADTKLKSLQLAHKEKEGELQTKEASARKLQGQLFQVKTNKEYTAMQREIETIKADNSLLEEAIIGMLDAMDKAVKERAEEQRRLEAEQQRLRVAQAEVERELSGIQEQLSGLEQSRGVLTPQVPPRTLASYERVLTMREGLALVSLVNDACGGCYRRLPPQVINQVYLKAKLVTCENCNRILYFDEAHSKL